MCGNPINAATGNKFQAEVDFIGATFTGLSFVRYYNSQDAGFTTLGAGWRTSWQRSLSISPNAVVANGADGRQDTFTNSNGVYTANPNVTSNLQAITSGVVITSYQLTTASDDIETYSPSGQLLRVTSRAGLTTTLGYDNNGNLTTVTGPFGHTLTFVPDGYRRIASMTVPDGGVYTYQYDTYGNLVSVTHPDNSVRQYLYEDSSLPNFLTGIIDENGARFATWVYDSQGRAIASQHAGGVELTTVSYGTNAATVTDPNHATHTYNFETLFGVVKPVSQTGVPVPSLGGKAFTYDANGFLASLTDYINNIATYVHDARGDETSRTLASGTAIAHTISTTWHPTFHLPAQIVDGDRTTSFSYDANGNLTSKTAFAPGTNSTWSYSYTSAGQVLTATGPRGYVTSYTYDSKGDLTSITNPLGQVIRFTSYDADGRLLSMTDANGLITNITYNFRGEVTSRVAGTWRTIYTYDAAGQLVKMMLPDHSLFSFAYDVAHRLVGVTDHQGNRIVYTLDAASNRTVEQVFDTSNDLVRTHSYTYDAVNRLLQSTGAQGQVTEYHYDLNSNFRQLIDPLGSVTINRYDELNRLKRTLDPNGGDTALLYDAHDRLVHVHDPRSLSTLYNYNGLDEPTATISRDTGTTSKTYDAAGNVVTSTDARGVQTSYSYDALNRLTQATYADGTSAAYSYDQGANGVGHLTGMKDVTGATAWGYEIHGLVQSKTQSSGGISLTTALAHDSYGRLSAMTYPSGALVAFDHDVNGQVRGISYQPPGVSGMLPLLEGIHYQPFGPVHRWLMGNGADYIRRYDLDGRIKRILLPAGGDIALAYDAAGRITSIAETGLATKSFGYDKLNRLTGYANGSQSQTFAYDADGNRVGLVSANGANSATVAYSYDTKSNRLLSITNGSVGDAFGYDANGNTVSDQSASQNLVFGYDTKNRLASAVNATLSLAYGVNGLGQRTFKANTSTAGGTFADPAQTYFFYDEAGHLTGQYDGTGAPQQETVWLGDLPVATIQNGSVYYIAPDHLGAPHQITNGAQSVVWFWDHDPFGNGAPTGDIIYSLRLPGQFYDVITGLYNNGFRDYNPSTGRYIESDPIGLEAGINTYVYVGGNPVSLFDRRGLTNSEAFGSPYRGYTPPGADPNLCAQYNCVCATGECAAGLPPITQVPPEKEEMAECSLECTAAGYPICNLFKIELPAILACNAVKSLTCHFYCESKCETN